MSLYVTDVVSRPFNATPAQCMLFYVTDLVSHPFNAGTMYVILCSKEKLLWHKTLDSWKTPAGTADNSDVSVAQAGGDAAIVVAAAASGTSGDSSALQETRNPFGSFQGVCSGVADVEAPAADEAATLIDPLGMGSAAQKNSESASSAVSKVVCRSMLLI